MEKGNRTQYDREYRQKHRVEINKRAREHYRANKEFRLKRNLCSKEWYQEHRREILKERKGKEDYLAEQKVFQQRRKERVLTHYGNGRLACVRCGFSDIRALSIDHINGKGTYHRIQLGGSNFYGWLIKNNYPEGYQTLCMNCNWIKRYECNELRRKDIGIEC